MKRRLWFVLFLTCLLVIVSGVLSYAWDPLPVQDDPLVRMPGTQPHQVSLEAPNRCLNCHGGYFKQGEPGYNWQGSMMTHAARDFLFWPSLTVAAQDSIWAVGRPNATDICLRCHTPKGWLEGRSDPTNGAALTGADFDGVQCDFCHRMYDPFFKTTHVGAREGGDWLTYWDETNASSTPSQPAADATRAEDAAQAQDILLFNGNPFYSVNDLPLSPTWTENAGGQYFVSAGSEKRASFADAAARHQMLYSRYHKSKFFCSTCHDVSNPVLANLDFDGTPPGDGATVLPTEASSAYSYFHVERTFSEFMLSDYGQQDGAPGIGPFAPDRFATSHPNNHITKCQDCHMRDVVGQGANKNGAPIRPYESIEHPNSGLPLHDLTGGNVWVPWVLASAVPGSPNYDAVNDALLNQGLSVLSMDLSSGQGVNPEATLAGSARAEQQLRLAASIDNLTYSAGTGDLSFRLQNQTGHKLISGYPEGRRMFVNIRAYIGGALIYEVNPYDAAAGTLKGLMGQSYSDPYPAFEGALPDPTPLGLNEAYVDELVYETHPKSSLTGESHTFHFALADERDKDNRIPPKGFRIADAASRLIEPAEDGKPVLGYFTAAEYAGGYDDVSLTIASGAEVVEVNLYYQTTSREYVQFLSDEIDGRASTLTGTGAGGDPPYLAQTDPFFAGLKAWGATVWKLWEHNKDVPSAAPFLMTQATVGEAQPPCGAPAPTLLTAVPGNQQVSLTWSDEHTTDSNVIGYSVYYDQAGKAQLVTSLGIATSHIDTGLTNGQQYAYKVTSRYSDCESDFSNILSAIPNNQGQARIGAALSTGRYETTGKGKNKVITFIMTETFSPGDEVVVHAHVTDNTTGLGVSNVVVEIAIDGPESVTLTTAPSDANGVAEAIWPTEAPNKKGVGGTTPGGYTATTTNATADGYEWDGQMTSAAFTLQ